MGSKPQALAAPAQPSAAPRQGALDRAEHHRGTTAGALRTTPPGRCAHTSPPGPPPPPTLTCTLRRRARIEVRTRLPRLSTGGCGNSPRPPTPDAHSSLPPTSVASQDRGQHPTPAHQHGRLRELTSTPPAKHPDHTTHNSASDLALTHPHTVSPSAHRRLLTLHSFSLQHHPSTEGNDLA